MRRLADRLSYRTLGAAGLILFALAGALATYCIPVWMSTDAWFAMVEGTTYTGLFLGLLLSFTGATVVRAFMTPRKRD